MNRLLAILTVLSVLTHAVVGCCAHTVHFAACHTLSTNHGKHCNHEPSHSHHNDCDDSTPPSDHDSGEDHSCHHAKCQWLPSSNNIDRAAVSPFNCDCLIGEIATLQAVDILSRRPADPTQSPPRVPLRSHLALSVLLI
ncbi:hypothetical protein [Bythopirellula polymerisocia]|uniref:Secreted protein n=1 Tax=Bythopirellula polymerisocia TaxID=2528003 RepID=A0A5C6CVK4_9BACT|nr:hypothetical protein [Bythopirellula polymerisocia]TWU27481.1 hypothetical protein Pla144_22550 [Bythopirellula polymerisocia]